MLLEVVEVVVDIMLIHQIKAHKHLEEQVEVVMVVIKPVLVQVLQLVPLEALTSEEVVVLEVLFKVPQLQVVLEVLELLYLEYLLQMDQE